MSGRINTKINSLALPVCAHEGEERGRHFAVQLFETHTASHRPSFTACLLSNFNLKKKPDPHSKASNYTLWLYKQITLREPCNIYGFSTQHIHRTVGACVLFLFFPYPPPSRDRTAKWNDDDERTNPGLDSSPTFLQDECGVTDWLAGWLTDGLWSDLNRLTFRGGGGVRKELVMSPELTWKHTRGERNKERERERLWLRRIGVLLHAPCGGIHACMPFGLSSTSACVICCFRCVMSQLPGGALYLCVQARIWCSVHWLGHGSWPEVLLDRVWISLLLFWEEFSHTAAPSATFRREGL